MSWGKVCGCRVIALRRGVWGYEGHVRPHKHKGPSSNSKKVHKLVLSGFLCASFGHKLSTLGIH